MSKADNSTDMRGRNRGRTATGVPNPVDIHVGSRVRLRRTLLGMSQEKLGEALGLTFQQVQKYERGANRIGASRMFEISRALGVPVSFFFDDMPEELTGDTAAPPEAAVVDNINLTSRANLELIRSLEKLPEQTARDMRNMVRRVANGFAAITSETNAGAA